MRRDFTRRQMIALSGATLYAGVAEANSLAPTHSMEGRAFASHWRVTAPSDVPLEPHRAAIDRILAKVDAQMSPWRQDSDVSRFNRTADACRVSGETAFVTRAALKIARESGGRFDPTVGPLVSQWGFGRITGVSGAWTALATDGDQLRKDISGLTIDLCGIAKGRALDLVDSYFMEAGLRDVLIDLGGELKSRGQHPSGRAWHVAVEDPRIGALSPAAGLRLPSGFSVATSGLRAQSYSLGDHVYSHIIDPHRARPVAGGAVSVSVLAPDAMIADGWATALMAAADQGPDVARQNGLSALFLFAMDTGLSATTTGDFDRHML
ncbi:FAD:protein FMN transferase [Celeribacter sp. PS-C1]|uniref:FAD:protein FMN transferase n=1 Tax=Celeribacter sp. PS-C1 TaxID=2820813 RepID=UPI001CA4AF57|nr:FAD:protein FMN transferase [Celeribacter sp. PS-C1]MBW6418580.1 FAD:protein FMN transferase [Celeribacter sp. PS-C1]